MQKRFNQTFRLPIGNGLTPTFPEIGEGGPPAAVVEVDPLTKYIAILVTRNKDRFYTDNKVSSVSNNLSVDFADTYLPIEKAKMRVSNHKT